MSLPNLLRTWESCKEREKFNGIVDCINKYVDTRVPSIELMEATDAKAFNSLLLAPFCDGYPSSVQQSVLHLIDFFGHDIFTRHRLLTSFSILKTLVYGLNSCSQNDKERLLKLVQCYTFDLHHLSYAVEQEVFSHALKFILRIIRQPKPDELLEPALGILASLSHFGDLVRQCLIKKDDFEALRKCLLYIMNSDTVSQCCFVYSIAIRFYLWKSTDKFFEGLNVHKTLEVLFNLLLNGEIDTGGLCAGELLGDMCNEPQIINLLASFPKLDEYLTEVVSQLRSKESSLVLKLLHLLRRLLENVADEGVSCTVRNLFLCPAKQPVVDHKALSSTDSLNSLFALASASNDLVASASVDFLIRLLYMAEKTKEKASIIILTPPVVVQLLERVLPAVKTAAAGVLNKSSSRQSLLRCILIIRLADNLLCLLKENADNHLLQLDQLQVVQQLANCTPPLVMHQLENNVLFNPQQPNVNMDAAMCFTSAGLAIDATGLLYSCAELLAAPPSTASQADEVSLTQPTGEEDTDAQSAAKQCGRSLQELLELSLMPPLLALGLLVPSRSDDGLEIVRRSVVVRLLTVIFSLQTFDGDLLAYHLDRLQFLCYDCNQEPSKKLARMEVPTCGPSSSFLCTWFCSTGEVASVQHPFAAPPEGVGDLRHIWSLRQKNSDLEQRVDKLLSNQEAYPKPEVANTSDLLSIFEYKIRVLQSREEILESGITANAEALSSANRLCEHYRERAVVAEAECTKLRTLQLSAVSRQEENHHQLIVCNARLDELTNQLREVQSQLSLKQQDCQDLTHKNTTLQSKLTAARERNHAMDAILDDYRRQLDQAKGQIESQTNQITKFTQITRLINDLTGNPNADIPTTASGTTLSVSVCGEVENTTSNNGIGDTARNSSGGSRKMSTRANRR